MKLRSLRGRLINFSNEKEEWFILTAKIRDEIINCYDNTYTKDLLKKWRTFSTGCSQYKVKNYSDKVISDFEEMGFNVLTYNDLILEEKCYD